MSQQEYYRQCYLRTEGWLPVNPASPGIAPGDFCTLQRGELRPLGNIMTDLRISEDMIESRELPLSPSDWRLQHAVSQVFAETERSDSENDLEPKTRQVLEFEAAGGFVFDGHNPRCTVLLNWSQIVDEITIGLTQSHYAFREVYVITGVASVCPWSLTIAGKTGAKLETFTRKANTDVFSLMTDETCQVVSKADISTYARSHEQPLTFVRGKRLVMSNLASETLLGRSIADHKEGRIKFLSNWIDQSRFDALQENELNLATCLKYFDWVNTSLDDVERLYTQG
jgi:hypothetical protein